MASSAPQLLSPKRKFGLALWMARVLEECDHASESFSPDPVHDLRVALRRCRSVADGMIAIDPAPDWKRMKKAGRELFRSLGSLRDVHVMQEWVQRLGSHDDVVTVALMQHLAMRETECKQQASGALANFDRKQWRKSSAILPRRAARLRPGNAVFKHLALERWTQARELHRLALRNRSKVAFHNLRIGLKRFRYIVENFLPDQHAAWSGDLKEIQDLLGEVHDLDVLWATALQINAFPALESRSLWQMRVAGERGERIQKYRNKMVGKNSLWQVWRTSLPQGKEVRQVALVRLKLWASILDPDFHHSSHVTKLALQLYDGLPAGPQPENSPALDQRSILNLAALLHDVGRSKNEKQSHKASYKLIGRLDSPLGCSAEELHLAAVISRYHQGALPHAGQKTMRGLTVFQRQIVLRLAGILRLADAFDASRDSRIQSLRVDCRNGFLEIKADGYSPRDRLAERIAAARHLLEVFYHQPVMIKPLAHKKTALQLRVG
jgi:exopolyphosphatase/guanosine-5'-triphosphate,3'-diphosphate pyrophosphatase